MRLRYFLLAYLCVYVSVGFLWRSYRVWKRTGINPITFKNSDSAHDFILRVATVLFVIVLAAGLLYTLFPAAYEYALPIRWLEYRSLQRIGVVLLILSLVWIVTAQTRMGGSWRVGVDDEHRAPLVQTGLFSISRNPIFLGIMITLLGLFLVMPNALTLLAVAMAPALIGIQVRLEEEYLMKIHIDEYEEYCRRVPRWF